MDNEARSVRLARTGYEHYKSGNYELAIKLYNEAILIDPKSVTAYYNRGAAYASMKDYEKARADQREACRLDPATGIQWKRQAAAAEDAFIDLGSNSLGAANYDDALAYYEDAIQLDPENAAGHVGRGIVLYETGEIDKAIKMYDEALRIDSKYVDALMNRAIAHVSAGKYDCAIADLSQVLVIDPEDLDAYALRAESFEAQGHHEKAEADRRAAARRK
ncbi:MAG TPA: tetratricopeptide repeat protein [Isosphaeraceae bacterium]|nr:tetratricopeptide repeat protein [Isosphaeraceae bacterium]